jgi:hypothetical protein
MVKPRTTEELARLYEVTDGRTNQWRTIVTNESAVELAVERGWLLVDGGPDGSGPECRAQRAVAEDWLTVDRWSPARALHEFDAFLKSPRSCMGLLDYGRTCRLRLSSSAPLHGQMKCLLLGNTSYTSYFAAPVTSWEPADAPAEDSRPRWRTIALVSMHSKRSAIAEILNARSA